MYPPQDNISNSARESDITGFINDNYNRLSQTTATTIIQTENVNCNDPSCNCNKDTSMMNNPVAHSTISPTSHNQFISHNTLNNNDIISSGNNHQQPIFNDVPNNYVNISPKDNYQQSMSNNTSLPQSHSQYINQNPPQTNVFPSLNSLGIVINSPQTYVVIMPAPVVANPDIRQQDIHSITDSLQTQFKQ
ncbi:hypothetical protein RclHR1_14170004 [Rhizophagus clarus]|uniref:Uncharacterized protein n=1 Tax=Rhizophagus clarus TaxID=94130 RepID=A0A2Z6QDP3_9GLOM|nr:hypothetical protein RclHR1_14170004 [Rhizophagus clarus]GES95848.1 hypothetical protein GLOIN_2v1489941 [Rhizophagus clarus]